MEISRRPFILLQHQGISGEQSVQEGQGGQEKKKNQGENDPAVEARQDQRKFQPPLDHPGGRPLQEEPGQEHGGAEGNPYPAWPKSMNQEQEDRPDDDRLQIPDSPFLINSIHFIFSDADERG